MDEDREHGFAVDARCGWKVRIHGREVVGDVEQEHFRVGYDSMISLVRG